MKLEIQELLVLAEMCVDNATNNLSNLYEQGRVTVEYQARAKAASIALSRAVAWLDQIVED